MKKVLAYFLNSPPPAIVPYLPDNTRIYCIGDIHGCNQLLVNLLKKIEIDGAEFSGKKIIIYLGDYIDRGTQSKEVIETIIKHRPDKTETIYLRGNHEQILLDFLLEGSVGRTWFAFGGLATLASYGVAISKIPTKKSDFTDIQQQLKEKLPESHFNFLAQTTLNYTSGSYYFVHAGIRPGKSLVRQKADDLLWIRDEFISSKKNHEKIIVHGHTLSDEPELLENRIGIDTGAYASKKLSCMVLEANKQKIIQSVN